MKLRKLFVVAFCLIVPLSLPAGEGGKVREIDAKDVKVEFERGQVSKPKVIASKDELAKVIPNAAAIEKQVDFSKEKLALFAWGGSGGDKLTGKLDADAKNAVFTYVGGRTRDLRRHVHLFVIPKDAVIKIEGAPK